jgi:hypothetical protein
MANQSNSQKLTVEAKDELLDSLLIEKKKESLRGLVESRLQQVIAAQHVRTEEEIRYALI